MATWTIKPKKGTTAEWQASGRVLEVNEWGVEETVTGHYILRIGDGINKFPDLPAVVDTENLSGIYSEINDYASNMKTATEAANSAAETASAAAERATEISEALEGAVSTVINDSTVSDVSTYSSEKIVSILSDVIIPSESEPEDQIINGIWLKEM